MANYEDWDQIRRVIDEIIAGANRWPGKPGEHRWIAHGLDAYHAVNLREALKLVPDTGDWHGSLRAACNIVLQDHPDAKPNISAEDQRKRADNLLHDYVLDNEDATDEIIEAVDIIRRMKDYLEVPDYVHVKNAKAALDALNDAHQFLEEHA